MAAAKGAEWGMSAREDPQLSLRAGFPCPMRGWLGVAPACFFSWWLGPSPSVDFFQVPDSHSHHGEAVGSGERCPCQASGGQVLPVGSKGLWLWPRPGGWEGAGLGRRGVVALARPGLQVTVP